MLSVQTWEFRKLQIPKDKSEKSTLAKKLLKYNVSILDYLRNMDTQYVNVFSKALYIVIPVC